MTDSDPATGSGSGAAATVFFSYSRADQVRALPIIRLIEQAGFSVWWDGLIEGGDRFSKTTAEALDRATAVVVLWSKTSVESHWVHDEATRGRDKRILVPLSLDGTALPLGFGQFQAIDLSRAKISAKGIEIRRMIRAIATLHGDNASPAIPRAVPTTSFLNRRAAIAAGSVALLSAAGFGLWRGGVFNSDGAGNRIAVLPFKNVGDDPERAYLPDGLCAEIRSMLAQNGALEVVGQASSEAFSDSKLDSGAIAKKLKADFLVDGAVQVAGGIIRITAELIDGKSGINRLPQNFEKPMDDILAVQREIAAAISAKLTSRIAASHTGKMALGGTANVIAFDHYLRGKDLYAHAKDETEEREGLAQFEAAIAADPKFAAAHAGRARALMAVAGAYGSASEIVDYEASAISSAKRAIEIEPKLADAHSTLALVHFQSRLDMKAARAPFELSRKLGEGEAPVLARFAAYAAAIGRDQQAVEAIERALLLDPLNALVHRIAGTVHYAARRYPESIAAVQETIKLSPQLADTHSRIGMSLLAQNKNQEALKEFETDTHKWSRLAGIAIAQHRLGNAAAAKAAMDGLVSDTDTVSLYQQGQVLAQWGDVDAAVAALESAREQRDGGMTGARYDPALDPLRTLPRFNLLLKSLGFD